VIITSPIFARLAGLVVVAVLLELSFFSRIPMLGTVPAVLPVVVVVLGLLGGAVIGASSGFGAGLLVDAALGGILGVTSLALMAAGYLAGRWRETYDIVSTLVPPILTGVLTGVASMTMLAIHLTLGIDASISVLAVREPIAQALMGGLLATGLFPLTKWILRPALVDDVRRRSGRRPAPSMLGTP